MAAFILGQISWGFGGETPISRGGGRKPDDETKGLRLARRSGRQPVGREAKEGRREMSEALTHARIWRIAGPIVLSNATVPLIGAVDTAVVGRMGMAAPIGAVGLGAVILATLYWAFGFLRMGTSGLAAQAHGAGDAAERGAILLRALMIGGLAGAAIVVLQVPLIGGRWRSLRAGPRSRGWPAPTFPSASGGRRRPSRFTPSPAG